MTKRNKTRRKQSKISTKEVGFFTSAYIPVGKFASKINSIGLRVAKKLDKSIQHVGKRVTEPILKITNRGRHRTRKYR